MDAWTITKCTVEIGCLDETINIVFKYSFF